MTEKDAGSTADGGPEASSKPDVAAETSQPSAACSPGGSGFDLSASGIALDRKTCLAWERDDPVRDAKLCLIKVPEPTALCWEEATKYCAALRLGGRSDWRLPTIAELATIVDKANVPTADKTIFPQVALSLYWSSEKRGEKIVCIDFSNGGMVNDHIGPDGPQAFRCVRDASTK